MAEKIKELVLAPDSQTIVERELIVQPLIFNMHINGVKSLLILINRKAVWRQVLHVAISEHRSLYVNIKNNTMTG